MFGKKKKSSKAVEISAPTQVGKVGQVDLTQHMIQELVKQGIDPFTLSEQEIGYLTGVDVSDPQEVSEVLPTLDRVAELDPVAEEAVEEAVIDVDPAKLKTQEGTIAYCNSRGSMPEMVVDFEKQAKDTVKGLSTQQKMDYVIQGLTEDDLVAVSFYTTNAAYAINAVLRGLIFDGAWVAAFKPWGDRIAPALAKMPKGAVNSQGSAGKLDPSKADDAVIDLQAVYRNMDFSAFFTPVFSAEYKQGRIIQDNGVMSTTLIKDSYGPDMAVKSTIEDVDDAKVIQALSVFPSENEALLPPGTQLRIAEIVDRKTSSKVADPEATYGDTVDQQKFDVLMKVVQAPPKRESGIDEEPENLGRIDASDPLLAALDAAPPLG